MHAVAVIAGQQSVAGDDGFLRNARPTAQAQTGGVFALVGGRPTGHAIILGVLFVLPIVLNMFVFAGESWQWIVDLGQYLPMAAAQMATTPAGDDVLRGILTLAAWPAALLLGAWAALRTRDA